MAGENVDNFFEQTVGSSSSNPLNLTGIVKGADGTQAAAIIDARDAASAITQLNLALAALRNVGIVIT